MFVVAVNGFSTGFNLVPNWQPALVVGLGTVKGEDRNTQIWIGYWIVTGGGRRADAARET